VQEKKKGRAFGFVRPPEKKESFGEIFADFFLRELQTSRQFLSKGPEQKKETFCNIFETHKACHACLLLSSLPAQPASMSRSTRIDVATLYRV
jgi:hypothetical protein